MQHKGNENTAAIKL